ncbi:hypothetical protein [Bacillus atrophaeus]|uniref:hypothetical protein n=1 Tax=Bacillus atrophaeus TaxID=1452 RepID=UPI001C0F90EA|nr:hypothetical protein [Bacillus atrophaeus]MBU5262024.1 hypothetical protein [Bacillus atrophaeus]MCY8466456.1 hypothetical protein [Bacillus atrophaeus]MCY8478915.1 hypothetical protein [Bacillus atrophaeus]
MYNKEEEKQKVLSWLKQSSQQENKFTKKQNFARAISFALGEVDEFQEELNIFLSKVSHLQVYQEMIKDPFTKYTESSLKDLRYLIEKNYSDEEIQAMPKETYNQLRVAQEKRIELLRKVAQQYIATPTSEQEN